METATTPMLRQYRQIKGRYEDCILFFRLGDFYEMFCDDAVKASKALDLVLTTRGKGTAAQVPMCGVPFHAAETYIARLIQLGYKVAICEQVEDPATAQGLVKRDVIRVISSGTFLDEKSHDTRYLAALVPVKTKNKTAFGLALHDPASGTIQANEYPDAQRVRNIIGRLPVKECVFPEDQTETLREILPENFIRARDIALSPFDNWPFNPDIAAKSLLDHWRVQTLSGFGLGEKPAAVCAGGALLEYLKTMAKQPLRHIDKITVYADEDFVAISPAAVYGLELDKLFKTIDHTSSALGRRCLRDWMDHPLKAPAAILQRQAAVSLLKNELEIRSRLQEILNRFPDTDKCLSKISCGFLNPKDFLHLRQALEVLPTLRSRLKPLAAKNRLFHLEDVRSLRVKLSQAINPDMPLANAEGKIIQNGFHSELDGLRHIRESGQQWLKEYQRAEIQRTGISSLKVGFNKVFGYYLEVTKTHLRSVPPDYIRKQTLVNAERFITPELKEYEDKLLTAQDKIIAIEQQILKDLQREILDSAEELHAMGQAIGVIDALLSLSRLADSPGYTAPVISEDALIQIEEGRHPVVERGLVDDFTPNDTLLNEDQHLIILTGPNMAGKSTYIRQTALLVILAQMGSYIPAKSAHIGVVDKIFTRIGAHDDIARGQSTFMVEMSETADILNNLTPRSLVILDEIGRGTSTFDGLALAWALAEHLQTRRARTLFATHFHELTALASELSGVKNYNVAVKEWKDEIIFLHKIGEGSTDDSYGIYVAKLAGIPDGVIARARRILTQLEMKSNLKNHITRKSESSSPDEQLSFFAPAADPRWETVKKIIDQTDINTLTPLEALNRWQKLKEKIEDMT